MLTSGHRGLGVSFESDHLIPLVDEGLGNASYLVALGGGRALVLDPSRNPAPYVELAERLNLRIAFAVETHLHADFVSGSRELAAYGFRWFPAADPRPLATWLDAPDVSLLDHNQTIARRHFSLDRLVERLGAHLREAGWLNG